MYCKSYEKHKFTVSPKFGISKCYGRRYAHKIVNDMYSVKCLHSRPLIRSNDVIIGTHLADRLQWSVGVSLVMLQRY